MLNGSEWILCFVFLEAGECHDSSTRARNSLQGALRPRQGSATLCYVESCHLVYLPLCPVCHSSW